MEEVRERAVRGRHFGGGARARRATIARGSEHAHALRPPGGDPRRARSHRPARPPSPGYEPPAGLSARNLKSTHRAHPGARRARAVGAAPARPSPPPRASPTARHSHSHALHAHSDIAAEKVGERGARGQQGGGVARARRGAIARCAEHAPAPRLPAREPVLASEPRAAVLLFCTRADPAFCELAIRRGG